MKQRVPAIEGWFTLDEKSPHLLGSRCTSCKSTFFPRESLACRNPGCTGRELEEVPLSRTGRIWSFTNTCYRPPAPYVPRAEPFEPFALAAVELDREKMVVLGQVASGTDFGALRVGLGMELVLETLYEDDESEYLVWKWKPVAG